MRTLWTRPLRPAEGWVRHGRYADVMDPTLEARGGLGPPWPVCGRYGPDPRGPRRVGSAMAGMRTLDCPGPPRTAPDRPGPPRTARRPPQPPTAYSPPRLLARAAPAPANTRAPALAPAITRSRLTFWLPPSMYRFAPCQTMYPRIL